MFDVISNGATKAFDIVFAPAYGLIGLTINLLCDTETIKTVVKEDEELSPDKSTDSSVQYWLDTYSDKQSKKK